MKNSQLKRQAPETVSTELEQVCAAVPQVLARTSAKLEERYYIRLAKEAMVEPEGKEASPEVKVLEGEVQDELAALRHSARHLVQAYQARPEVVRPQSPGQRGHRPGGGHPEPFCPRAESL